MGRIKDWFNWKFKHELPAFTSTDFYLMLSYYDTKSLNIAVVGNKKKYEWVIDNLIKQVKKENKPDNKILKNDDNMYTFLRNDMESKFVLIEDIHEDLEKYGIKYRKYM